MVKLIITSLLFSVIGFYSGHTYLYMKYRDSVINSKILHAKEMVVLGGAYMKDMDFGKQLEHALSSSKETLAILRTSDELSRGSEAEIDAISPLLDLIVTDIREHNASAVSAPGKMVEPLGQ